MKIPGQAIHNSTRIHQVGSNLRIDDVQQDNDAGDYVCIASSKASGARQASPPARLSIICKYQTNNLHLQLQLNSQVLLGKESKTGRTL